MNAIVPGSQILAKLEGWARQYPGMVNRKHADGTFDIVFDDGDRASHVPAACIFMPADGQLTDRYGAGTVPPQREKATLPIRPTGNNPEEETAPPPPSSPVGGMTNAEALHAAAPASPLEMNVGDSVEAKAPGWTSWYRGVVINAHSDGTVDVKFEDGDFRRSLSSFEVRHYYSDSPPSRTGRPAPVSAKKAGKNQSRPRPQSAAPSRRTIVTATDLESTRGFGSGSAGHRGTKRPSTAPRSRQPAGGALSFAQWKRSSVTRLYGGAYGVGNHRPSSVPLQGTRSYAGRGAATRHLPISGTNNNTHAALRSLPRDLAEYISSKVNPVLVELSEQFYLEQPTDIASYLADYAAKLSARTIGQCHGVVQRISNALASARADLKAASFFTPHDRDHSGAITFASFAAGLESLQASTGVHLAGDDVGKLYRDFDGGNGFIAYAKFCDLIESLRMSETMFERRFGALVEAATESGLNVAKLLAAHMQVYGDGKGSAAKRHVASSQAGREFPSRPPSAMPSADLYANRAFVAGWQDEVDSNSTTIAEIWEEMSKDSQDCVHLDELKVALKRLGLAQPEGAVEEWQACVNAAGNSGGKVDFVE